MSQLGICFIIAVALVGCYGSGGRNRFDEDSSTDSGMADGRTDAYTDTRPDDVSEEDTAADPGTDPLPDGWRFEDRDIPDRIIHVYLPGASLPDIAFSGSSVGLVYRSEDVGADFAVGYVPLSSRGEVIGDESVLVSGWGFASVMPRIAQAGDGDFLVALLKESTEEQIIMQRLSAAGSILGESTVVLPTTVTSPISPPLRIDGYAFVAASARMPGGEGILFLRFAYPSLEFDGFVPFPFSDCAGGNPVITKDPVLDQIMLFHDCFSSENVVVEWLDTSIHPTGATTIWGHVPVTAFHASSSPSGWFGYGFEDRLPVTSLQFWEFNPADDAWLAPDIEAHLYSPYLDSDHSDVAGFRTTGAVFNVMYDETWEVWARLSADPPYPEGEGLDGRLMTASDPEGPWATSEINMSSVAWTEGGFLVVWDRRSEGGSYYLYSSFIELIYDY